MANQTLTSTQTYVQSATRPAGFAKGGNTIHGIAPGGGGGAKSSNSVGGRGGGAGAYGRRANVALPSTYYYFLPPAGAAAGSNPSDAWFDDLNLLASTHDYTASPWSGSNANINITNSTGTSPAGANTATLLGNQAITSDFASIAQEAQVAPGTSPNPATVTISQWFSPGTSNYAFLVAAVDTNYYVVIVFDLLNGVTTDGDAGSTSGTVVSTKMVPEAGGYWCYLTLTMSSEAGRYPFYFKAGPAPAATGNTFDSYGNVVYTGTNNQYTVYAYGPSMVFGDEAKPYAANTASSGILASLYLKAGTAGTASVAGTGGLASGCQADTAYDGGDGAANSSSTGGPGGGAAGKDGAGGDASGTTGGSANNGGLAGGAIGTSGSNGTEFDGTYGAGSGAGGANSATARNGGRFGGGGAGARGASGTQNAGAGGAPGFFMEWTPASFPFNQADAHLAHLIVR